MRRRGEAPTGQQKPFKLVGGGAGGGMVGGGRGSSFMYTAPHWASVEVYQLVCAGELFDGASGLFQKIHSQSPRSSVLTDFTLQQGCKQRTTLRVLWRSTKFSCMDLSIVQCCSPGVSRRRMKLWIKEGYNVGPTRPLDPVDYHSWSRKTTTGSSGMVCTEIPAKDEIK